jgi:hypothetical protein
MPFDPNKPFEVIEDKGFDPNLPFETLDKKDELSFLDSPENQARLIALEKAATLNTRPSIAGLGAGAGAAYSKLFDEGQGLGEAISAAKEAFGSARNDEILKQEMLEKNYPSESLQGGLAGGLLTAPLTPVNSIGQALKLGALSGAGEAIGSGKSLIDVGLDVAGGTAGGALGYGVGKGIGKTLDKGKQLYDYLSNKFGDVAYKGLSKLSLLPEDVIKNYSQNTNLLDKLGNELENDLVGTVNKSKENALRTIFKTKGNLSKTIDEELSNSTNEDIIPVDNIVNALEEVKSKFNPKLRTNEINEVNNLIDQVKSVSRDGKTNLKDLYDLRDLLQENSKSSFVKPGGLFPVGKYVSRAAKAGMNEAKDLLENASPEIQKAHDVYSKIRRIDEVLPRNLLKPLSPPGAYLAAGSGQNPTNNKILKELSAITGEDLVKPALDLATASIFKNPSIAPASETGKSFTQAALGHTLGEMFGNSKIGTALTSPLAIKKILQTKALGENIGNAIREPLSQGASSFLSSGLPTRIGAEFSRDELFELLDKKKNPAINQPVNLDQAKQIYLQQESGR